TPGTKKITHHTNRQRGFMLKFQALILQIKSESNFQQSLDGVRSKFLNDLIASNVHWSTLLSCLFLIICVQAGSAQTLSASQKFTLGIKAAPHFTWAHYRDKDLQKEF